MHAPERGRTHIWPLYIRARMHGPCMHARLPARACMALHACRYNLTSGVNADNFLVTDDDGEEPVPNSVLINGVGQAYCGTSPSAVCSYAVLPAMAGTCKNPRTKIRIVNTAAFGPFNVTIDGHSMIVSAVPGRACIPAPKHASDWLADKRAHDCCGA